MTVHLTNRQDDSWEVGFWAASLFELKSPGDYSIGYSTGEFVIVDEFRQGVINTPDDIAMLTALHLTPDYMVREII